MSYPNVYLKKDEDRRLQAGHLWIYSNEIDTKKSPLKNYQAGQLVTIVSARDKSIGVGYINPQSLITVRVLDRDARTIIDEEFFIERLKRALQLRQSVFAENYYRLVFSESDFLPGVIIDRYGDYFVMQISAAGMELHKETLCQALQTLFQPKGILLQNQLSVRTLEGLKQYIEVVHGEIPELCTVVENGISFQTSLLKGQKTGWFYDHRNNRQLMTQFVKGKRVLDVFSYVGAWSVLAACHGASHVTAIDSSAAAHGILRLNAEQNNVANKITITTEDVFVALDQLKSSAEKFDVIILDPPAFIKKRKDIENGKQAYLRVNELALQLLNPHGVLFSASCSQLFSKEDLLHCVRKAGVNMRKKLQIVAQGGQGFDHPILPAMPETDYLKLFALAT